MVGVVNLPCPRRLVSGLPYDLVLELVQLIEDTTLEGLFRQTTAGDSAAEIRFGEYLLFRLLMPENVSRWKSQPPIIDIVATLADHLGLPEPSTPILDQITSTASHRRQITARSSTHEHHTKKAPNGFATIGDVIVDLFPTFGDIADLNSVLGVPLHELPKPLPWRQYAAAAGFNYTALNDGETEILDMTNRVLIQRKGWGHSDRQKLLRSQIEIIPSRLSRHGKRLSERTYQRATNNLINLLLLTVVSISSRGVRCVTPSWWAGVRTIDPVLTWRLAARRQKALGNNCHRR